VPVTQPRAATLEQYEFLSVLGYFAFDFTCFNISGYGPKRHLDDDALSVFTRTTGSATALTVFGKVVAFVFQVQQCPELRITFQYNAATPTAIAAVRAAKFDKLLATKVHRTIAASA
jgi:hypothetical protein